MKVINQDNENRIKDQEVELVEKEKKIEALKKKLKDIKDSDSQILELSMKLQGAIIKEPDNQINLSIPL